MDLVEKYGNDLGFDSQIKNKKKQTVSDIKDLKDKRKIK